MTPSDLHSSRNLFRQLLQSSPDPVWLIDGNKFVECNDVAARTLGYASREELLSVHPSKISPPTQPDGEDSFVKAERMIMIAVKEGVHRFDWVHSKVDGTNFYAEVTLAAVELESRAFIYCAWRDITAIKRTEADLQKREKQLLALSSMSSDWFWMQDEQFRFTDFSGSFAKDFTPPEGSLGKARWELNVALTPEQWDAHRATLEAHLPFRNLEYPIIGEAGELRWYTINGDPLYDESGRFVGYHGTGRNITESKKAEESIRIAGTAFETQQGMSITDARCVILRVNQAFARITGYSAEEMVGKTPDMFRSGRNDNAFYKDMWDAINSNGFWQGEIWNQRKNGEIYPAWLSISAVKDSAGTITHYVREFADISERKDAEKRIETLAFYDSLTGLPNRALLRDRLQHAMTAKKRRQHQATLLHIDLDNFRSINDTLGHEQGDQILEEVARRLRTCARASDTLARIGGDEFILLLEDVSLDHLGPVHLARSVGEKVLAALRQPFALGETHHHSSASIGITLLGNTELDNVEEPLKQAELAMYQAKTAGRNTLRFFDTQMQAEASARSGLESRLREALAKNQFVLHYQPQVDYAGQVTGSEALVRWLDPKRGMVSPAEFIPVAEQSGLILPLGQWVLETACNELVRWANDPKMAHLTVAVNVSARQFHQSKFVDEVLATLKRTGADPKRLKLELTESMLVDDIAGVITKMSTLKGYGVNFSLDDFGTGYSSLVYLKSLPLDQLKIDQGFVRDILVDTNDAAIAKMVISLADTMGLSVIAEGVETEGQRAFLASAGCRAYQGYLFSRPLPIDEFEAFVKKY